MIALHPGQVHLKRYEGRYGELGWAGVSSPKYRKSSVAAIVVWLEQIMCLPLCLFFLFLPPMIGPRSERGKEQEEEAEG